MNHNVTETVRQSETELRVYVLHVSVSQTDSLLSLMTDSPITIAGPPAAGRRLL